MMKDHVEDEVIVHPVHGMQLSEGYIRRDGSKGYLGSLPGLGLSKGKSREEVLAQLEKKAKTYYGDDVIVEIAPQALAS